MRTFDWITSGLVIVGALNWALWGIFGFNFIAGIFGTMSTLARIAYIVIGLSALYQVFSLRTIAERTFMHVPVADDHQAHPAM